jgi:predicted nucleic acid-binding protein
MLIDYNNERHRTPFAQRIRVAQQALTDARCDIVYVNSVAASEFVVAAKSCGKVTVLNVHEKAAELRRLMEIDLAKFEVLSLCDGIVLAAGELRRDLAEVFGFVPERCLDLGIAVDAEEISRLAGAGDAVARNAAGDLIAWGGRLVIGMCGQASPRKGADIFFETASLMPEYDFVWIGSWRRPEAPENNVFDRFLQQKLPNLYVTDGVDNPYKYLGRLDLFFLSSREDPNPLVLAESMLLNVPIISFSRTTAVGDFLGRSAILCHGRTNTEDAVRVLRALDLGEIRSTEFRRLTEGYRHRYDISEKVGGLARFIASLQPAEAAAVGAFWSGLSSWAIPHEP